MTMATKINNSVNLPTPFPPLLLKLVTVVVPSKPNILAIVLQFVGGQYPDIAESARCGRTWSNTLLNAQDVGAKY